MHSLTQAVNSLRTHDKSTLIIKQRLKGFQLLPVTVNLFTQLTFSYSYNCNHRNQGH